MISLNRKIVSSVLCVFVFLSSGCSTFNTLENAQMNSPKLYTGTRLNFHAINGNKIAMRKFNTEQPKYPLLDLPGSFVLDTIFLPAALYMEMYEEFFY